MKSILFNNDSKRQIEKGIDTICSAVAVTLGPGGRNVVFKRGPKTIITKDGVSVAKEIFVPNPQENLGVDIIKDACKITLQKVGDGTTTTAIVTGSIFKEGLSYLETKNINAIALKKALDVKGKEAIKFLSKKRKSANTLFSLKRIAKISANGDDEIADLVSRAVFNSGKYGNILIKRRSYETKLETISSMRIDKGQIDPRLFTNSSKMFKIEKGYLHINECLILLVKGKISKMNKLENLLRFVSETQKPLVIIADEFSEEIIEIFLQNLDRGFPFFILKSPSYGPHIESYMEDLATILDTEIVEVKYLENENVLGNTYSHYLREVDNVLIGSVDSFILPNKEKQNKDRIQNRITSLIAMLEGKSEHDINTIKDRISNLEGSTSVIHIYAASETEEKEIEDRIDDAKCATLAAFKNGYVAGGGLSLVYSALQFVDSENEIENIAIDILKKAFFRPLLQIHENLGIENSMDIINMIVDNKLEYPNSINLEDFSKVNLLKEGIIDPFSVAEHVIKTSISLAGSLLTTECSIVDE